ncbi:MAG: hypothetical protein ALECFALPRED_005650 [Alectoria fallacina]|uniref:Uncharacterized protein n=1 Tax=Alectoria fallacina TaxID=1903189 RepID=A0A8H3G2L4_9LECA|nr:MAG: hypothetical protein ALECFALPRED_005650 [Alectoria fallacina]
MPSPLDGLRTLRSLLRLLTDGQGPRKTNIIHADNDLPQAYSDKSINNRLLVNSGTSTSERTSFDRENQKQVVRLSHENAKLREIKAFANRKIQALTIFAAHQNDAISVPCTKFRALKESNDSETLKEEVNDVLDQSNGAVGALVREFPDREDLVRRYVDMISDENSLQARANCLAEFNLAPTCKDFYTEVNTIYRGVNDFRFHRLDAFNQFIAVR